MEALKEKERCVVYEPKLEPWIETYSGKKFYLFDPQPEQIDIEDIAHALSNVCRFGGHVKHFYSVAEHCVHVSTLTRDLHGLLHDASEAYVADIVSPLKPHLTNYRDIEDTIMWAIARKYNIIWPVTPDVKDADVVQLKTEARHLLPSKGQDWVNDYPSRRRHGIVPHCWVPAEAKMRYLARFEELHQ